MVYAGVISYFSVPLIVAEGWVGTSEISKYISYLLVFIAANMIMGWLMKFRKVLLTTKVLAGVVVFGGLLYLFAESTMVTIKAAGWM